MYPVWNDGISSAFWNPAGDWRPRWWAEMKRRTKYRGIDVVTKCRDIGLPRRLRRAAVTRLVSRVSSAISRKEYAHMAQSSSNREGGPQWVPIVYGTGSS